MTQIDSPEAGAVAAEERRLGFFDPAFRGVVRNSTWSVAATGVTVGAYFVETTILARHFGPHRFGIYLLVIAYPEAVQLFFDFRTREAMTKYLGTALARGEGPRAAAVVKLLWLVDVAVVCGAYAVVFVTAPFLAERLTGYSGAAPLMRIYGLSLLAGGLDATAGSVLRVFDRFGLSFAVGAMSMLVRLALIVTAVALGTGIHGVVWVRVAAEVVATCVSLTAAFLLLSRALWNDRRAGFDQLAGSWREILAFLMHMNVQASLRAAARKLDVIVVGAIAGPSSASLYKIGVQYGSSPLLFSDPLFSSVYPQFAREHALGRTTEIARVGKRASLVLAAVAVPVAAALAVGSKPLLVAVVGPAFGPAWAPFAIALCGAVPAVVFFWGRAAMLTLGDVRTASTIAGVSIVIQFAMMFLLVPVFHATGGATGFAAMNVAGALLTLRYLRVRGLI